MSKKILKKMAIVAAVTAIVAAVTLAPLLSSEKLPTDFGCTLGGATGSIAGGVRVPMAEEAFDKIPSKAAEALHSPDIFFGQTMDNPWWPTRHTVFVIQPEDGYKYVGTKAYIWGFWTGLNEKGFGWAGAYVGVRDTPAPEGIDRFDIGPLLLGGCANVNEAIELLEDLPRSKDFPCRNAIMGDAEGNLALVEISYEQICVETLTNDGYVVRTNHFISDEMKGLDYKEPDPYYCDRFERGTEWFESVQTPIQVEDMFEYFAYVYQPRQDSKSSGPGSTCVIQPKELTYWFTYGWPGGNLPPKGLENRQICQSMTWGTFIPFYLPELPPGQYTTELGQLTPLGVQYLYSHFSSELQRSPAWLKYQSDDPMEPFYKPAEDIVSPDGYAPKENPYGPGGFLGTWTSKDGFIPFD